MQHKHIKTFAGRSPSEREKRLLHVETPKRGAEFTQNVEEWRNVFDTLRDSADYKRDKKLQKFLKDENNLLLVASVVELPGDRKVDWLPATARKFAQLYREEFTVDEGNTMKDVRGNSTTEVSAFVEKLKTSFGALTDHKATMEKRNDIKLEQIDDASGVKVVDGVTVDALPDIATVEGILDQFMKAGGGDLERSLRDRQFALIDLAREVIRTKTLSKKFITDLFTAGGLVERLKSAPGSLTGDLQGIIDPAIPGGDAEFEIVATDGTPPTPEEIRKFQEVQKKLLEKIISYARLRLVSPGENVIGRPGPPPTVMPGDVLAEDGERKKELVAAQEKALAEVVHLDAYETALLNQTDYVEARKEYFNWIAGENMNDFILDNIDIGGDYKFNIAGLKKNINEKFPTVIIDDTLLGTALLLNDEGEFFKNRLHPGAVDSVKEILDAIDHGRGTKTFDGITEKEIVEAARALLSNGKENAKTKLKMQPAETIPDEIIQLLISMWNTGPLLKYLGDIGVDRNKLTSSLAHVIFRSYIGEQNATILVDQKLGSMRIGTIIDLGTLDAITAGGQLKLTPALLALFATKERGKWKIKKDYAIEFFKFLAIGTGKDAEKEGQRMWEVFLAAAGADKSVTEIEISEKLAIGTLAGMNVMSAVRMVLDTVSTNAAGVRTIDKAKLQTEAKKMLVSSGITASEADTSIAGFLKRILALPDAKDAGASITVSDTELQKLLAQAHISTEAAASFAFDGISKFSFTLDDFSTLDAATNKRTVDKAKLEAKVKPLFLSSGMDAAAATAATTALWNKIIAVPGVVATATTVEIENAKLNALIASDPTLNAATKKRTVDKAKLEPNMKPLLMAAGLSDADAKAAIEDFWKKIAKEAGVDPTTVTTIELDDATLREFLASFSAFTAGDKATDILKLVRDKDLKNKPFTEEIADVTMETLGSLGSGAKKWWGWMSEMPQYYFDANLTRKLLAVDDRRLAMQGYADDIEAVLAASEANGRAMEASVATLQKLQQSQDDVLKPLGIANGAFDNVEQGYTLNKAAMVVIDRLNEVGWDLQPWDVRKIAFWIAMKSESGGDSIAEAVQFLKDYQTIPEATLVSYVMENVFNPNLPKEELYKFFNEEEKRRFADYDLTDDVKRGEFATAYAKACVRTMQPHEKQNIFLQRFIAKHDNRMDLERFLVRMYVGEEESGRNIMAVIDHKHNFRVRPMALQALMGRYQTETVQQVENGEVRTAANQVVTAERVGRWLIDRDRTPEQQASVKEAIDIVLDGPPQAKQALLDAFINKKDVSYHLVPGGAEKTITAVEATDIVRRLQAHLTRLASAQQENFEQLEEQDFYANPLERGLRGGIETLRDLWSGDWVDKAKVIAAVVAGVYIIRKLLKADKDSPGWMKLAKWSVIGIPLLIVANSAIKSRTGRDYMGEWLKFMPKEERATPLERFRRRGKEYDKRYAFLGTNAGHEALRQLSGPESNISVQELLAWRNSVQSSPQAGGVGYNVYENGAPNALKANINSIQFQLGPNASEKEAYECAYFCFEALLVDVATLRKFDGTMNERAERGADIVRTHYVDFEAYRDRPDLLKQMQGRRITMMDVIIYESQTPATLDAISEDRNFMEWLADAMGWTLDEAKSRMVQLGTAVKLYYKRTGELLPELRSEVWSKVSGGLENIYDYWRAVRPRLKNELGTNIDAAWRTFLNMLGAAGIAVQKGVPGTLEFTVNLTEATANLTLDVATNLYRQARMHNTVGNVTNFLEGVFQNVFGANLADLIALRGSVESNPEHVRGLAEFSRMAKGLKENLATVANIPGLTDENLKKWRNTIAEKEFGFELGADDAKKEEKFNERNPYERMAVYELLKRRLHSLVVARRIEEIQKLTVPGQKLKYPITIDEDALKWNKLGGDKENELADDIDRTFGINTLSLIGVEKDLAGAYQEWLKINGGTYTRPPLEFLHWAIDWATFDTAPEHLRGEMELYTDQYMRKARKAFEHDPDKQTKLENFGMYLETVITNVMIEAAMGARTADQLNRTAGRKAEVMTLMSDQAMHLTEYINTLRGSSVDPDNLHKVTFEQFKSFGLPAGKKGLLNEVLADKTLMMRIQSENPLLPEVKPEAAPDPGAPAAPKPPKPLEAPEKKEVEDFLADTLLPENVTLEQLKAILPYVPRMSPEDREKTAKKFDAVAEKQKAKWTKKGGLDADAKNRDFAYALLRGVGNLATREGMERELIVYLNENVANMVELEALRKEAGMSPDQLLRLQTALDKVVVLQISDLLSSMNLDKAAEEKYSLTENRKLSVEKRMEKFDPELKKIAALYKYTNLNKDILSDILLLLAEHLLYFGVDNLKEEGGRKGFAKFKAVMQTKYGVEVPDTQNYSANGLSFDGSALRMEKAEAHVDRGGLGTQSWLDMNLDGTKAFGRLKAFNEELNAR